MASEFRNKEDLQPVLDDFLKQLKSRFGNDIVEESFRSLDGEYFGSLGWIRLVNHNIQIIFQVHNTVPTRWRTSSNGSWYIRANLNIGYTQRSFTKLAEDKDYFPWFDEKIGYQVENEKARVEREKERTENKNIAHDALIKSGIPYDTFEKYNNTLNPNTDGGVTFNKHLYIRNNTDNFEKYIGKLIELAVGGSLEVSLDFDIENLEELKEILFEKETE